MKLFSRSGLTGADEGISGADAKKRPDFMRMIRHCKKGKIDLIITKSVSRFARNTKDAIEYVRLLKTLNVGVLFEKEGINTLEESSELFLTLMFSLAQEELNSLSLNVKMGIRMAMKEGHVTFNFNQMYGFKKGVDGQPEVIPSEAKVVQHIYSRYLLGDSVRKIITGLHSQNIFDQQGKKWTDRRIRTILTHERYCGDKILQKTYVTDPISKKTKKNNGELPKYHIKNCHDFIVTREIWNQAQAENLNRTNKPKKFAESEGVGKYNSLYALSEILICGDCGTPYQRTVWKKRDNTKQPVWRCRSRMKMGTKYCQDSATVDERALHAAIVEALFSSRTPGVLSDPPLETHIRTALEQQMGEDFDLLKAEQTLEQLKAETLELVNNCMANNTLNEKKEEIKALSDKAKELHERIQTHKNKDIKSDIVEEKMREVTARLASLEGKPKIYDDELVRQTIHTIKVLNSSTIQVYFKDGTQKIQTMEAKVRRLRKEYNLEKLAG